MNHDTPNAIYRDILANPDDLTLRGIFADWLEEFGNEDNRIHAAMIRQQLKDGNPVFEGQLYPVVHTNGSGSAFVTWLGKQIRARWPDVRKEWEPVSECVFVNGMVEYAVYGTIEAALAGAGLHPLKACAVLRKAPQATETQLFGWHTSWSHPDMVGAFTHNYPHVIPEVLFDVLPESEFPGRGCYVADTREAAMDLAFADLSRAIIAYTRKEIR